MDKQTDNTNQEEDYCVSPSLFTFSCYDHSSQSLQLERSPTSIGCDETEDDQYIGSGFYLSSEATEDAKQGLVSKILQSFKRGRNESLEPETTSLKTDLNGFSLQMIAIGGSIGTGLLLGSGKSLSEGGPVPLLLGYGLVSTFIFCMCQALGELSVAMPIAGSFTNYSSMLVDKSWGFAMGWNYCLLWLTLLPMELVATSMTFDYWPSAVERIPHYGTMTIFYVVIIAMNLCSIKYYGLFEVAFSVVKVVAILFFLVLGVLTDVGVVGNQTVGFRYWNNPGKFTGNGPSGFIGIIVTAAFSFSGSELVGMAASESRNPDKDVPKAIKQVFWRICGIYLVSLFVVSLLVPYNHPNLVGASHSDVNNSPFVLALSNTRSDVFANIMNCVILVSILSVGNSAIYASSRTLIALAENGQAPACLKFVDRQKRPLIASIVSIAFGTLAYVSVLWPRGAETMFMWLMSLSGVSVICTYATITLCHIRFRKVLKINHISYEEELPFCSQVGVVGSWYGLLLSIVVVALQVYTAFKPANAVFTWEDFGQKIIGILVVVVFYGCHKVYSFCKYKDFHLMIDAKTIDIAFGRFANEDLRNDTKEKIRIDRDLHLALPWYKRVYNFWC